MRAKHIIGIIQMPAFRNRRRTTDTFFRRLKNQLHRSVKLIFHL